MTKQDIIREVNDVGRCDIDYYDWHATFGGGGRNVRRSTHEFLLAFDLVFWTGDPDRVTFRRSPQPCRRWYTLFLWKTPRLPVEMCRDCATEHRRVTHRS